MELPRKVYAIQHNVTKRIYVGSSKNVEGRYWAHIYALRNGSHPVDDLQNDFNQYGEDFSLFVLDEIRTYEEKFKEYDWMDKYQSHIRGLGYNYKDVAFRKTNGRNKLPIKVGLPSLGEKENASKKEKYIQEIGRQLEQCNDILLLDLVLKLLSKSLFSQSKG